MNNSEYHEKFIQSAVKGSKYHVEEIEYPRIQVPFINGSCKLVDSIVLPSFIKNLDVIKNLKLRSDDCFVIGIPKSG
jgi:hypothetical protein